MPSQRILRRRHSTQAFVVEMRRELEREGFAGSPLSVEPGRAAALWKVWNIHGS